MNGIYEFSLPLPSVAGHFSVEVPTEQLWRRTMHATVNTWMDDVHSFNAERLVCVMGPSLGKSTGMHTLGTLASLNSVFAGLYLSEFATRDRRLPLSPTLLRVAGTL